MSYNPIFTKLNKAQDTDQNKKKSFSPNQINNSKYNESKEKNLSKNKLHYKESRNNKSNDLNKPLAKDISRNFTIQYYTEADKNSIIVMPKNRLNISVNYNTTVSNYDSNKKKEMISNSVNFNVNNNNKAVKSSFSYKPSIINNKLVNDKFSNEKNYNTYCETSINKEYNNINNTNHTSSNYSHLNNLDTEYKDIYDSNNNIRACKTSNRESSENNHHFISSVNKERINNRNNSFHNININNNPNNNKSIINNKSKDKGNRERNRVVLSTNFNNYNSVKSKNFNLFTNNNTNTNSSAANNPISNSTKNTCNFKAKHFGNYCNLNKNYTNKSLNMNDREKNKNCNFSNKNAFKIYTNKDKEKDKFSTSQFSNPAKNYEKFDLKFNTNTSTTSNNNNTIANKDTNKSNFIKSNAQKAINTNTNNAYNNTKDNDSNDYNEINNMYTNDAPSSTNPFGKTNYDSNNERNNSMSNNILSNSTYNTYNTYNTSNINDTSNKLINNFTQYKVNQIFELVDEIAAYPTNKKENIAMIKEKINKHFDQYLLDKVQDHRYSNSNNYNNTRSTFNQTQETYCTVPKEKEIGKNYSQNNNPYNHNNQHAKNNIKSNQSNNYKTINEEILIREDSTDINKRDSSNTENTNYSPEIITKINFQVNDNLVKKINNNTKNNGIDDTSETNTNNNYESKRENSNNKNNNNNQLLLKNNSSTINSTYKKNSEQIKSQINNLETKLDVISNENGELKALLADKINEYETFFKLLSSIQNEVIEIKKSNPYKRQNNSNNNNYNNYSNNKYNNEILITDESENNKEFNETLGTDNISILTNNFHERFGVNRDNNLNDMKNDNENNDESYDAYGRNINNSRLDILDKVIVSVQNSLLDLSTYNKMPSNNKNNGLSKDTSKADANINNKEGLIPLSLNINKNKKIVNNSDINDYKENPHRTIIPKLINLDNIPKNSFNAELLAKYKELSPSWREECDRLNLQS